jgi:hypothetical protein
MPFITRCMGDNQTGFNAEPTDQLDGIFNAFFF